MPSFTDLFISLAGIAASGLQVGWPLLIAACGLAGIAYFGEKDRVKTAGAWIIAAAGFVLFVLNWKWVVG